MARLKLEPAKRQKTAKKAAARRVEKPLIGFIGQGWIGKNYADDFERRKHRVVRYGLEPQFAANKDRIAECDIAFVAVPANTTPEGFDDSNLIAALALVGKGKTAVVKSSLQPGTTARLQRRFPDVFVMHSPEFLSRNTAAADAAHPAQNIVGIPVESRAYKTRAQAVIAALPKAPSMIVPAQTAEFFKYAHNASLFVKSLFSNVLFEAAEKMGVDWDDIKVLIQGAPMLAARDPDVRHWHIEPRAKGGRGVGGDCLPKDFETFLRLYQDVAGDVESIQVLKALRKKNLALLGESKKDLDLLATIYGDDLGNL